jgi:hypothetical protein
MYGLSVKVSATCLHVYFSSCSHCLGHNKYIYNTKTDWQSFKEFREYSLHSLEHWQQGTTCTVHLKVYSFCCTLGKYVQNNA